MMTIAIPPFRASPTPSTPPCSPSRTVWPRPPAPTNAAITTMPSAIMIVWFTPSMMDGFASGTCSIRSRCRSVEPNDVATSSEASGTFRMPSAVSRIAGGIANARVAINAGGFPMPKSSTAGRR